jgi:hypothetical protein
MKYSASRSMGACNAAPDSYLQDEDSDEYGPEISPASAVAEAIRARTEEHLKKASSSTGST